MLSAVQELGALDIKRSGKSRIDILLESPASNKSYTKAIMVELQYDDTAGKWHYNGVSIDDYQQELEMRYCYRRGPANSYDFSPTARISGKPEGTVERKLIGWFRVLDDSNLELSPEQRAFLENICSELGENEAKIKSEVVKWRREVPSKENMIISLRFCKDGRFSYIGDHEVFPQVVEYLYHKKQAKISSANKVCSVCGETKKRVFGNCTVFKFSTWDKEGYITGGFDKKLVWRNFPVCASCQLDLLAGKAVLEEKLTFRFAGGITYQLLPRFIFGSESVRNEILDILFEGSSRRQTLSRAAVASITVDEEDILGVLKDEASDSELTVSLLFIEKQQSAERILLVIEDVFPSRLRTIFNAKASVDKLFGSSFTFANLRNIFDKSDPNKREYDLTPYFLDTVDRVFKAKLIDRNFLMQFMLRKVRYAFVHDQYFANTTRNALQVLSFLLNLNLIEMEGRPVYPGNFDEFFDRYGEAFCCPVRRGLFLLGALTELLLRKQYRARGSRPFLKQLKGLKMSERDFKGLLPKIQNKLEEYESFDKGKRLVATEAASCLLQAGDNWKMSVDEMNFYFACGMSMLAEIIPLIYPEKAPEEAVTEIDINEEV